MCSEFIEVEFLLNCPPRYDLLRLVLSRCVRLMEAQCVAACMLIWDVHAGIKLPLIAYEVQHWRTTFTYVMRLRISALELLSEHMDAV